MPTPRLAVDRLTEPTWRVDAQCRQKNAGYFFAPAHFERKEEKHAREGAARALCGACRVQAECLEYALTVQEPHGIWGGMNELERRRLLRKRAAEAERLR
jgi:WhiB family redox-sensing transcriptional regulator